MAEIKGNLNVKKNATIDGMLVINGNIADNASTPKLSIDPNNRILYASDGTTEIIDWSKTGIASAKVSGGENLISLNDLAFFTNFDGAFNFVSGAYQEEGSWKNLGNGYAIITANDPYVGYGTTCIQGSADSGDDTQTFQLITFPDGRFTIGLVGDTTGEIGTITGDVSGNINIMGVINDDSDGMSIDPNNRILYGDDGTTSRLDWSGTGVAVGGKISNYNNIATVSNGVPSEYATVDLTTQGAAIGTTTLYAVPASGAGMYRVSYSAKGGCRGWRPGDNYRRRPQRFRAGF